MRRLFGTLSFAMLMKHALLITALVMSGAMTLAQEPAAEPSSAVLQSCLVGTPNSVWATLKLTHDQLVRIGLVQEACKEECELPGVKKVDNPISNADGNTVMSEVKNILGRDQYQAWVAYCSGSPAGAQPPK